MFPAFLQQHNTISFAPAIGGRPDTQNRFHISREIENRHWVKGEGFLLFKVKPQQLYMNSSPSLEAPICIVAE